MRNRRKKAERRSRTILKKNFQNKFLKLIIISLVSFLIISLAAFYIALRIKVEQAGLSGYTEERLAEVFAWLNWVLPLLAVVLIAVAVIVGKQISFRIAGPLYALEKQLDMLLHDKISRVQLRSDDNEMIPMANLINELIEKKFKKEEERNE